MKVGDLVKIKDKGAWIQHVRVRVEAGTPLLIVGPGHHYSNRRDVLVGTKIYSFDVKDLILVQES